MAADNTRKTSNVIHDLAEVKQDVSNNSQNIQNNTDAIGNISIPSVGDGGINLEAGDGLTLSAGSENATANQDSDTTFKIEANLTYLKENLNIPTGGVSKIIAGDNVTISPENGTGNVTINAAGSGSGGIEEAPIDGKQYGREDGEWTEVTSSTPVVPGDGNITLKSTDNTVSITGQNATANQTTDTAWDLSVNIPTPATPGDGKIDLSGGTGINVTGANATANQSGNTAWSVAIDDTVALKSDIPTIPDIPSVPANIVETLNNLSGNLTLESSDDKIVVAEDGTDKINLTLNASLSDLSDVSNQTPADDQILTWNDGTKKWEPAASQSGGVTTLAALDDTNVSTPTEGQTLVWNNTDSKWENADASGGVSNLPISSTDGTVVVDGDASVFTVDNASRQMVSVDQVGDDGTHLAIGEHAPAFQGGSTVSGIHVQGRNNKNTEIKFTTDATTHGGAAGGVIAYGDGFSFRDRNKGSGFTFTINTDENAALQAFRLSSQGLLVIGKDGTNTTPVLTWKDDVNTGISRSADDEISFIAGGAASLIVGRNEVIVPTQLQTDTITSKDAANPSGGVTGDATINLGSHITVNANAGGTDEELVAVFSSYYSQSQRGLQIKNGINANRANAHVVLDAKSDGDLGLITIQTDGNDALTIGKTTNGEPVDIAAFAGYVPQTDQSLVTKGWVTANGASGNLPISSTDGKVRLEQHSTVPDRFDVRINDKTVQSIIPDQVVSWGQFSAGAAGGFGATKPAYTFSGADTDTGMFLTTPNGKNAFNIGVGGQERVTVDSAGNVGVGSAPHTSNRLMVEALDETLHDDSLASGTTSSGTSQIFIRNSSNTPGTFSTLRFTDAGGRAGMLNFVYDSPNNNQGGSWHFTTRQANSIYKDVLVIENIQDGGNVIVNPGEIRTDNPITTKDSANLDASIQFYGKNYLLRSRDGLGYAVIKGAEYDPAFNGLRYLGETGAFAISNYVPDTDAVVNISNRNINRASTIDFSKGPVSTNKDESKRWASISNPDRYKGLEYRVYSSSTPETWTNAPPHVFYATAPSDATGAEYEILRMLWNRFTVSTGGEERVVVDATATSLKKGNYLALEDATGLRCGVVQGSAGRFFVQALNSTDFYLRATNIDYAIVKPSEQDKGLQTPRGITSPFVRGLADTDASVTLGGKATVSAAPRLCETVWDSANNQVSELFASKNIQCYSPNGRVNYVRPDDTQSGYVYWYDVNLDPAQKSIASVGAGGFTLSATETLGFAGDGINFAANSQGDQATVLWAMKQDGGLIGGGENAYIHTPSVRGLADNDSQITLGADLRVFANASSEEVFTVMHTGRVGINTNFPLGELHVGGEEASIILQKEGKSAWFQQALNDDLVFGTLADYGTVPPTVNSFLQIAGNGDVIINRQVRTPTISGLSNTDAAITLGSQATLKAGDGSEYVPTDDNSLVTRKFVEGLVGSGGNVNPDTVPGTGATAQWEEQSVEVSNTEPNQQAYSALYSYSGIFTDGLHWTSDGYQWNTSDPTSRIGYLSQTIDLDNNIVVKGNGNEYVTAQAISSDMKSWRSISGIGYNPFYLDGNFYTENGGQILDRTNARWVTSSAFGGSLPNDRNSLSVASQESGLYVLAVYQDGTVHWSTGLSGPSAWQQDARISGAKCCKFIERMGKWLVIGESEFWISDNANLGSVNWTNGTLPTSANWDRVVDDGGTISITSTAEKFNLVLYCTEENGPALQGDWQTTVNYNNRGYKGFTGTNGRTIGSMQSEVSGDVRSYYYGVSGDIRIDAKMDTRHVTLTNPVSISFARAIEAQTQEDANAVFTEEIQRRSPVLTLTQAEYDAIPADEIEDSTLYLITS